MRTASMGPKRLGEHKDRRQCTARRVPKDYHSDLLSQRHKAHTWCCLSRLHSLSDNILRCVIIMMMHAVEPFRVHEPALHGVMLEQTVFVKAVALFDW